MLVHDLTMEVRDAQEVVSYVGVNQQRGSVGVPSANCGPVGLDLGTVPQGQENRQYAHRVHVYRTLWEKSYLAQNRILVSKQVIGKEREDH